MAYLSCQDRETPLMVACLKRKEEVVKLLIDHGADVQVKDKVQYSYLQHHLLTM